MSKYDLVVAKPSAVQRFRQMLQEIRGHWYGPLTSSSPEVARLWGPPAVSSGVSLDEASALTYSAVWNAVGLISSQIGNLPCVLWKKQGKGKDRYDGHPLYRLIHDRPNPEMSAFTFRETLQAHVLTWGNAYAEIERSNAGRPLALWPLTPDTVTAFRKTPGAPIQYRVTQASGGEVVLAASDMLHVPGLGFDGTCGYSVIAKARESLGLGVAAERFGSTFFGNGATFGGVVAYKGPRPPELAEKSHRDQIEAKHVGVDRAHKFLMLYNDATYSRLGIPPNDAQFLETRTFQVDEVARWFNIPPHKLKELARSTNNNIEHQNLEYYIDCLSPWLERWEQELNEKLISPLERNQQEIGFVAQGLLRGDVAGRGTFYRERFNTASITPNDIRGLEDENPVDGGDEPFVNTAMIPLSLTKEWWQAQIDEKKANIEKLKQPPPTPVAAPAGPTREEFDALVVERDAARKKAQEEEDRRDREVGELRAELETVTTLRDEKIAHLEGALDRELTRANILAGERAEVLSERDVLAGKLHTADAVTLELRAQLAVVTGERDQERTAHATTQEARLVAETRLAVETEARTATEQALQKERDALAKQHRQLADTEIAARAVVVDRLNGLIEYEADRARQMQASPDKLRKWMERFYNDGHTEKCRSILRSSVRAWMMIANGQVEPLEHVLDRLVSQHVEQSVSQLRTVADEHDQDTMAPALERVLRRWEADRAESTAARVLV